MSPALEHSAKTTAPLGLRCARRRGFTLVEMMVVLGIIILVASLSIPMFIPMMRGRRLDQAADIVKSVCIVARSRAIKERKSFNVTLLEKERMVIITDYEAVRDLDIPPPAGHDWPGKRRGVSAAPYSPHYLANYYNYNSPAPVFPAPADYQATADLREKILVQLCGDIGEKPRFLPEGCRMHLQVDDDTPVAPDTTERRAWTWVFRPTGGVWTIPVRLPVGAIPSTNSRDTWQETTFSLERSDAPNKFIPSGPLLLGPNDVESTHIVVFAMTGQPVSMQ